MGTWIWVGIALLLAVVGGMALAFDCRQQTAHGRRRRGWARKLGWRYIASDPELPAQWRAGALGRNGPGRPLHIANGRVSAVTGPREAWVFDRERDGEAGQTVLAVRCSGAVEGLVVELWLPSEPFPSGPELERLGPAGGRYAFTTDLAATRPLIVPALITRADGIGDDIGVVWLERGWVLAAAAAAPAQHRLERLLRVLAGIADEFDVEHDNAGQDPEPAPDSETAQEAEAR